jgi:hypothetical protein
MPQSMCQGSGTSGSQSCALCTQAQSCAKTSDTYLTLFGCRTGNISFDTTICIMKSAYMNPLEDICEAGTYQDPFTRGRASSSEYMFSGDVFLNRDNTYLAEVSASGTVRIFRTQAQTSPFQVAMDPVTQGSPAPPVLLAEPVQAGIYPTSYRIAVDGKAAITVAAPVVEIPLTQLPGMRLISSGVWSVDGKAFFTVWMDGTISKAVVEPQVSGCFICQTVCRAWEEFRDTYDPAAHVPMMQYL